WPVTGSTGIWPALFNAIGVATRSFEASNCGVEIAWPKQVTHAHGGKPLKNIRISADGQSALGEATITTHGLEGNAIYPMVPALRAALNERGHTTLQIDLKPGNTVEELVRKIGAKEPRNFAEVVHLNRAQVAVLKAFTSKERVMSASTFAEDIKNLRIPVTALRPVGESISTVGGIRTEELSSDFSLKAHPHLFTVGEMVDWDAPTGGFLLQGCFAMGSYAALRILDDRGTNAPKRA
ncbi:MAG: NAD(P)/FAD-dependent oxidoreductase, partial [Flavobacteriales bacterium]